MSISMSRNLLKKSAYRISRILGDETFLRIKYGIKMKKRLNLTNPLTFNEKLQWLKLYDRQPRYTMLADKVGVRQHVAEAIGYEYLIPLVGVYKKYEEIDFSTLPNEFVLKPNHTSGNVFICKDRSKIDYLSLKRYVDEWLTREYYWLHREWPYKNIEPRILCEKYIADSSGDEIRDYKFLCFNGEPKLVQVMSERKNDHFLINHFDLNWKELDIPRRSVRTNPSKPCKPNNLEMMIEISRRLSSDIPFARIDLYDTGDSVYFGEITFFPVAGFMDFENRADDALLGSWIQLPRICQNQ